VKKGLKNGAVSKLLLAYLARLGGDMVPEESRRKLKSRERSSIPQKAPMWSADVRILSWRLTWAG